MVAPGNALSRNPNICASCSSLMDGMEGELEMGAAASPSTQARVPVVAERSASEGEEADVFHRYIRIG
jgi:hypothetical protein